MSWVNEVASRSSGAANWFDKALQTKPLSLTFGFRTPSCHHFPRTLCIWVRYLSYQATISLDHSLGNRLTGPGLGVHGGKHCAAPGVLHRYTVSMSHDECEGRSPRKTIIVTFKSQLIPNQNTGESSTPSGVDSIGRPHKQERKIDISPQFWKS